MTVWMLFQKICATGSNGIVPHTLGVIYMKFFCLTQSNSSIDFKHGSSGRCCRQGHHPDHTASRRSGDHSHSTRQVRERENE